MIDTTAVTKEVLQRLETLDAQQLHNALGIGNLVVEDQGTRIELNQLRCRVSNAGAEITITDAGALAQLHEAVKSKLNRDPFTIFVKDEYISRKTEHRILDESGLLHNFRLSSDDLKSIPGLIKVENTSLEKLQEMTAALMKESYPHNDIYGKFCFLGEHINVPYEVAFEYAANVHSLPQWTLSLRNLTHLGGGLYRGTEAIESTDPNHPNTEIFIRADSMKGPDHGLILYPCAWDQGHELWMRYYFILMDSQKTLNKPGTVVLWINCRHPYYDRTSTNLPRHIEEGQARADRQWVGDLWDAFYPLHVFEMNNLKRILEYRFQARSSMP